MIAENFPTGCDKGESRIPPPEVLAPEWPWGPFPCFVWTWDDLPFLQLPGIQEVNSSIVLSDIKHTTVLPI